MLHRRFLACLLCLSALSAGCADGTLPELNGMNPYLRRQWAQDLQFGPTFHEQVAELQQIAQQGPQLPPDEQQYRVRQLNSLILNSKSPMLRAHAVKAVAAIPNAQSVEGLRMAMVDEDNDVRIAACEAWRTRGGPEAITSLATLSEKDSDVDVRIAAVKGLGQFQDQAVIGPLAKALEDRDPAMQMRAMESLRNATGRDYGNNVAAWRAFASGGNPPQYQPSVAEQVGRWFN